jgi:hypothetical protein
MAMTVKEMKPVSGPSIEAEKYQALINSDDPKDWRDALLSRMDAFDLALGEVVKFLTNNKHRYEKVIEKWEGKR